MGYNVIPLLVKDRKMDISLDPRFRSFDGRLLGSTEDKGGLERQVSTVPVVGWRPSWKPSS